jgi:hypothetical protein
MALTGLHTSPNYVTGSWIWIIPAGVTTPMIMLAIGRNYTKKYGIGCSNVNEVKGYLDMFISNEIKNFTGSPKHDHRVDICLADLPGDIPFFLHPAYRDVSRQCHTFYNNRIIPLHDVERIARMCSSFLLMRSILDLDDIGFYTNTEQRVLAMSNEDYDVLSRDLSRYRENPFSIEHVASTRQFAYREMGLEVQLFAHDGEVRATCFLAMKPDDNLQILMRMIEERFLKFPFRSGWELFFLPSYYSDEEYLLQVTSIAFTGECFDRWMDRMMISSCDDDNSSLT